MNWSETAPGIQTVQSGKVSVSLSCRRHFMAGFHGLGVWERVEAKKLWLRRTAVLSRTVWQWCSQEFCRLGLDSLVTCSYVKAHVLVAIYQIIVSADERCRDVTLRKQHLRWYESFDFIFVFLVVCYGIQLHLNGNSYWCWEDLLLDTSSTDDEMSLIVTILTCCFMWNALQRYSTFFHVVWCPWRASSDWEGPVRFWSLWLPCGNC